MTTTDEQEPKAVVDPSTMQVEEAEAFFLDPASVQAIRGLRIPPGVENPYLLYKECRAQGGFVQRDLDVEAFGSPFSFAQLVGPGPVYTAVRYEETAQVLARFDLFSSTGMEPVLGLGRNMLVVDPPEHKRHRTVVQSVFGRRAMDEWRTSVIEPLVADGIDQIEDLGAAELMAGFIYELPVKVIGNILGLPADRLAHLCRLAEGMLLLGPINPVIAFWAFDRIGRLFEAVVDERGQLGGDDVISHLCRAEVDGESLTATEIATFLRLLLPAGFETVFRSIGSMLFALLSNPDQFERVRHDRSLIPRVVDETLRWESPVNGPCRVAVKDIEINGYKIPAGASVQPSILSANHDERHFTDVDPDLFDISRRPEPYLTFGYGPHLCLGYHLAKAEMEGVLSGVLERLPNLRFDPDSPAPKITGCFARGPSKLHVAWR